MTLEKSDVQIVLDALISREPTENEWENVPYLAALRRIEDKLCWYQDRDFDSVGPPGEVKEENGQDKQAEQ